MAIDVRVEAWVATVTMDRQAALNALDEAQLVELQAALDVLATRGDVRVVILTGAGERAFAAGADVKAMATMSMEEGRAFGRLGQVVTATLARMPQPVIAAVNGFALGGGCELAIACALRVASETAVFAQPEVSLGIPAGWGGTQRLTALVGPGVAMEMLLSGRRVDAAEALRVGLVNALVPAADLMATARAMATTIAKNGPEAVRATKRLVRDATASGLDAGLTAELDAFAAAFGTAEQREGMAAFVERRPAAFSSSGDDLQRSEREQTR
ncbi:MAG: enoyl-CoA hydratase/isomerase family protein [Chloroflexia bacterium]|nr:enoyl-CoA hydratase/isomerase family protein [Chloroflexia bacterium]